MVQSYAKSKAFEALTEPGCCRPTRHGSGRGLTSDGSQVHEDRYLREAELLVQGARWGVERIATGADLDNLDVTSAHMPDGVLAEPAADPLTPESRRDSEQVDLSMTRSSIESPRNQPAQGAVQGRRYACVAPSAGVVECRDIVAVVLLPVAMLM